MNLRNKNQAFLVLSEALIDLRDTWVYMSMALKSLAVGIQSMEHEELARQVERYLANFSLENKLISNQEHLTTYKEFRMGSSMGEEIGMVKNRSNS